ncbi:hypothetical protein D9M71_454160 [compost metagenome]
MDRAMLKVNSTSSRNGGIGRVIMASIASSSSGTPRLPRPSPARLLRICPISCVRSTLTPCYPGGRKSPRDQNLDAELALGGGSAGSGPTWIGANAMGGSTAGRHEGGQAELTKLKKSFLFSHFQLSI